MLQTAKGISAPATSARYKGGVSAWIALALLGCTNIGLEEGLEQETGSTPDTGPDREDEPVYISSLSPSEGPTAGGTEVVISGWGFGSVPSVEFGATSVDVTSVDDETLVVVTPGVNAAGAADVTVYSATGSYTAPDAFTYTDGGSGGDGGGLEGVAATAQISYQYNLCTDCWVPPADEEVASATVSFFDPVTVDFLDWLPAPGACATNPLPTDPPLTYRDAGSFVYLNSGARSITLAQSLANDAITYTASTDMGSMQASEISHNSGYDLVVATGGTDIAPYTAEDVVYTGQFFEELIPMPSGLFSYGLSSSQSTTWAWQPAGVGSSLFYIEYDFYNQTTGAFLGMTVCVDYDTGTMATPPSAILGNRNNLVVITLARLETGVSELPDGSGDLQYLSVTSIQGTGVVQ